MVFISTILSLSALATLSDAKITRELRETLDMHGSSNVFVKMEQGTATARNHFIKPRSGDRGETIAAMRQSLLDNAKASQSPIVDALSKWGTFRTQYESFWISNEIFIQDATTELLEALAEMPNVAEIHAEKILQIAPISDTLMDEEGMLDSPEWGLEKVRAPESWAAGFDGTGIVIGSIDTGVQVEHEALAGRYVGSDRFGWLDGTTERSPVPADDNGHGTHTIGTMVGEGGIGVAPQAEFMACRSCTNRGCTERALKACGQFMVCPHSQDQSISDCSLAPQIVSNSWGGGQGDPFYNDVIDAWRMADIIPVFAMGNDGRRGCGSANSPGDNLNVIAVGSTNINDRLSSYSSRGPARTDGNAVKPDVVAPGESVRSAWIGNSNASYNTISGTSMACPHVSGVIALLLQSNPSITYDMIYEALSKTTSQSLSTFRGCGKPGLTEFPNFNFGYGLVDSYASSHMAVEL